MSEAYDSAIRDLFIWQIRGDRQDNFTSLLLQLIRKADHSNREKLRKVYPDEVRAFEDWWKSENEVEFFKERGLV